MNLLDENIIEAQRQQLARWKIHVRQIGVEIGAVGMKDKRTHKHKRPLPHGERGR